MKFTTRFLFSIAAGLVLTLQSCQSGADEKKKIAYPKPNEVEIADRMWSPFLERMRTVTIPDVLDKFEGKHADYTNNTLRNFELVAEGHVADGGHVGFPWYDGLIYETITGISDYLLQFPDGALEARLDEYIRQIAAAQETDPDGYINTYTTLEENDHRWGENGGNLRWQHDVYNSGCLVEAGVHYYKATGKTKLLEVATRLANYMYDYMAGANHNVVPGHALPEDALIQLYHLYKSEPALSGKLSVPVEPEHYLRLAEFWIEQRGHTEGRRPLEAYAQDAESVFDMQTIEGHAVRATLLATGVADVALVNGEARYIEAANRLWDNMVGRRMFITGGVGAIHEDEKFGPDYFLPTDAYLETCAAIGAGLFSWRMNELTGDAKYMDIVERILFNSIPTAVSMNGTSYTYQNPLGCEKMNRWPWHDCPCCPPMLLKFTGMLPSMIYAVRGEDILVNLFIGSKAELQVPGVGKVEVKQEVDWNTGKVSIQANSPKQKKLRVLVRIPSWQRGEEMPLGLYKSNLQASESADLQDGYRVFSGEEAQDISLTLNTTPRIVRGDEHIEQLQGLCSLASGPFVYCAERIDNEAGWDSLRLSGREYVLDTENLILGTTPMRSKDGAITAIPFFAIANRSSDTAYRVWAK